MNKKTLSAILVFAVPSLGTAATVTWGAAADSGFIFDSNSLLESGNFVRLGYFNAGVTLANIQANQLNLSYLESNFNQVDIARIGFFDGNNLNAIGHTADSFSADTRPTGLSAALGGKQLAMWVLRSTNTTSLNLALSSLTHQAIFWAQTPTWNIPTDGEGAPLQTSIDLADLHLPNNTNSLSSTARIAVGTFPSLTTVTSVLGTSNHMAMAIVPEPTSAFLIAIGAAGLITRRRRQS